VSLYRVCTPHFGQLHPSLFISWAIGDSPRPQNRGGLTGFQVICRIGRARPTKPPTDIEVCHGLIHFCHSLFPPRIVNRKEYINISEDPGIGKQRFRENVFCTDLRQPPKKSCLNLHRMPRRKESRLENAGAARNLWGKNPLIYPEHNRNSYCKYHSDPVSCSCLDSRFIFISFKQCHRFCKPGIGLWNAGGIPGHQFPPCLKKCGRAGVTSLWTRRIFSSV